MRTSDAHAPGRALIGWHSASRGLLLQGGRCSCLPLGLPSLSGRHLSAYMSQGHHGRNCRGGFMNVARPDPSGRRKGNLVQKRLEALVPALGLGVLDLPVFLLPVVPMLPPLIGMVPICGARACTECGALLPVLGRPLITGFHSAQVV